MEIGDIIDPHLERWEIALKKARQKDNTELAGCLKDASLEIHQAYRDEIAAILTRGQGREANKARMYSAMAASYVEYMSCRKSGDKSEFAYEHAAKALGCSKRKIQNHVSAVNKSEVEFSLLKLSVCRAFEIEDADK